MRGANFSMDFSIPSGMPPSLRIIALADEPSPVLLDQLRLVHGPYSVTLGADVAVRLDACPKQRCSSLIAL